MKLEIQSTDNSSVQLLATLKEYIDSVPDDEVAHSEINRLPTQPGSLSVGEIGNALTLIIKAANKPLTELAKALRDFISGFGTEISITTEDGKQIKIKKGKYLSGEELVDIINAIKK